MTGNDSWSRSLICFSRLRGPFDSSERPPWRLEVHGICGSFSTVFWSCSMNTLISSSTSSPRFGLAASGVHIVGIARSTSSSCLLALVNPLAGDTRLVPPAMASTPSRGWWLHLSRVTSSRVLFLVLLHCWWSDCLGIHTQSSVTSEEHRPSSSLDVHFPTCAAVSPPHKRNTTLFPSCRRPSRPYKVHTNWR